MKNTSLIWAMALLLAGLSSCDNKNSCANREEKNLRLGLQEAMFKNSLYQANNLSSVVVDGKTYQNVLKLDYNAPDDPSSIAQVLYNQEYGIIQCRSKDGFLVTKI